MFNAPESVSFVPFSTGRRRCAGEKLALVNLFYSITRFMQLTNDCTIALSSENGIDLDPDPNYPMFVKPKTYKIMFKKINV